MLTNPTYGANLLINGKSGRDIIFYLVTEVSVSQSSVLKINFMSKYDIRVFYY